MKKRRAITLIEVLWVISFASIIFAVACSLLSITLDFSQWAQQREKTRLSVTHLSDQLRADIAVAQAVTTDSASQIALTVEVERTIRYQIVGSTLQREERLGEQLISREAYSFPEGTDCQFTIDDHSRRVTAIVSRKLPGADNPTIRDTPQQIESRIEATVGTRLKLMAGRGGSS